MDCNRHHRFTPTLKMFFKLGFTLLGGLLFTQALHASPAVLRGIPAFIEKNRDNPVVTLTNPKYNPTAKLYYFLHMGAIHRHALDEMVKLLNTTHRKLTSGGGALILFLDYQTEPLGTRNDRKRSLFTQEYGELKARLPIINTIEKSTQDALFKPSTGNFGTYGHKQPTLRAADADGYPIAFFYFEGKSVSMILVHGRGKRTIVKSGVTNENWVTKAINATQAELLALILQRESGQTTPAPQQHEKKKSGRKQRHWKKVY